MTFLQCDTNIPVERSSLHSLLPRVTFTPASINRMWCDAVWLPRPSPKRRYGFHVVLSWEKDLGALSQQVISTATPKSLCWRNHRKTYIRHRDAGRAPAVPTPNCLSLPRSGTRHMSEKSFQMVAATATSDCNPMRGFKSQKCLAELLPDSWLTKHCER